MQALLVVIIKPAFPIQNRERIEWLEVKHVGYNLSTAKRGTCVRAVITGRIEAQKELRRPKQRSMRLPTDIPPDGIARPLARS